jgi:hypothetical protein
MKRYEVKLEVTAILEVADGTTDDEFHELYHNIAGVYVNMTSSDERIVVISCDDEVTDYEEERQ